MTIDWSKAPDWAEAHALYAYGGEISEVWVGKEQYQRLDQPKHFPYGGGVGDARHNPRRSQFRYEAPRPAAWNGEDLPPIGTVCEFNDPEGDHPKDWFSGTLMYCSAVTAVVAHDPFNSGQIESSFYPDAERFRPARNAEQIAEEERLQSINQIIEDSMGRCDLVGAGYLYDATYRKQVTP